MALFPLSCVLLRFPPATYDYVRLGENRRAALLREKIAHFWIGNQLVPFSQEVHLWMGTK